MIAGSMLPSSSVICVTECPRMLYSTDVIGRQGLGCNNILSLGIRNDDHKGYD